jgi:hypothetical protein
MGFTRDHFELFFDKLKKPANAIMLILGILLLADLYLGCPAARQIVLFQLKLFKINPDIHSFRVMTIFGEFTSIDPVARQIDLWGGALLTLVPLISYFSGLVQAIAIKKIT